MKIRLSCFCFVFVTLSPLIVNLFFTRKNNKSRNNSLGTKTKRKTNEQRPSARHRAITRNEKIMAMCKHAVGMQREKKKRKKKNKSRNRLAARISTTDNNNNNSYNHADVGSQISADVRFTNSRQRATHFSVVNAIGSGRRSLH